MEQTVKIEFHQVTKKFKDLTALNNINLKIYENEIFGLIGKSGAGKSTLLRTINQLESVDQGKVLVDGMDVCMMKKKELRNFRAGCAMIFQHFSLMETKNVFDNIALPLSCNKWKKKEIITRVNDLAQIVGLSDKLKAKPNELSGGQRQRVAIARALALNPKILLCDEATSALDPNTTKSILALLKKINKDLGITVVLVTHQMEVVKEICDRIAVVEDGKILQVGFTDEIFLSKNNVLESLMTEDEILPSNGMNIKLFFPKSCSVDSLITKMARTLDIDFSICYGKLERFKEDVLGSLIINVKEEHLERVEKYIQENHVEYEVITHVDSSK